MLLLSLFVARVRDDTRVAVRSSLARAMSGAHVFRRSTQQRHRLLSVPSIYQRSNYSCCQGTGFRFVLLILDGADRQAVALFNERKNPLIAPAQRSRSNSSGARERRSNSPRSRQLWMIPLAAPENQLLEKSAFSKREWVPTIAPRT